MANQTDYKKFRLAVALIIAMIFTGACAGSGLPASKAHPPVALTPQAQLPRARTQAVETAQTKTTVTRITTPESLVDKWLTTEKNIVQEVPRALADYQQQQVRQAQSRDEARRTGYEVEIAAIQLEQALNRTGLTSKDKNAGFINELHSLAGRLEGRNHEINRSSRALEHIKQKLEKAGKEIKSLLHRAG